MAHVIREKSEKWTVYVHIEGLSHLRNTRGLPLLSFKLTSYFPDMVNDLVVHIDGGQMRAFLSLYKTFERSSFAIPTVFSKYSFIQTYLRLTPSTTTAMGKGLARLIGSGIAFTSEAAHAARHRNKDSVSVSETTRSISGVESDCGNSVGEGNQTTYIVALEDHAELPNREVRSEWGSERGLPTGDELPPYSPGSERQKDINEARSSLEVEEKRGYRSSKTGNDTENLALDTRNDRERSMEDEAAWQLDEATEEFALPTYDQAESHPGPKGAQRDFDMSVDNDPDEISAQDSEDVKAKKRERMIRSLVAMAGPPPAQLQRLPCPVIIPQRRPGAKKRGFVRAYAPVLADCGVSQDVFLKFISDFNKASQVGDYHFFS